MSFCNAIRVAAARVAQRARTVQIDSWALEALADTLTREAPPTPDYDTAHHHRGSDASTLAFNITLDTINFGSGYWPLLRKRPGLSGYFTVATSLKEKFDASGPWSAGELQALGPGELARLLGQDLAVPALAELMALFAEALRDLGAWLEDGFAGRFEGAIAAADGSAERMAVLLAGMPFYRDSHRYEDFAVPLFKRAQIVSSDLALAFGGRGPGRFHDLERLTIFPDNLVPHVLRCSGVLVYHETLARRIAHGDDIPIGSAEEVEIRASAVHAVECLVAQVRARGGETSARAIDQLLWTRGQTPAIKAEPRHRTRTIYY